MNQESIIIITYPNKMIIKSGDQSQKITSNGSTYGSSISIYF